MCHENAACSDVVGGENSYNCTCNPGFTGDGTSCVGESHLVTSTILSWVNRALCMQFYTLNV